MNVCVVGLGKIGLPLAVQYATRGHRVVGLDIDAGVVESVNDGVEPFSGEAGLAKLLGENVTAGRVRATVDAAAGVRNADVVVIVVPLIIDDAARPDFRILDAATDAIGPHLKPGALVSYETTLPVGSTRTRFAPRLAELSGHVVGEDLYVCHSPERVFSGRIFADLRRYPKLVGAVDSASARAAVAFYEAALDFDDRPDLDRPNGVWDLGSAEAAELAKLAETTYRDLNIGYANELAVYADEIGVDVYEVIAASNSQPFSHIHQPGVAVGGHCIPVYPRLYLEGNPAGSIPLAGRERNLSMPAYAVARLARVVGDLRGLRVVILGAAYRGGVKETAFSGVFPLAELLRAADASITVHDPLYSDAELGAFGFDAYHLGDEVDAAVVQTDHAEYRTLIGSDLPGARVILDGRRVLDASRFPGVPVVLIGRPREN